MMASALAGCATASSDRPVVIATCPPLVSYTKQFQTEAADALDALPPRSPLAAMIDDYSRLRSACRIIGEK